MSVAVLLVSLIGAGGELGVLDGDRWSIERNGRRERVDNVTIEATTDQVVVVVRRRFGIDHAAIRSTTGKWPKRVILRFEEFPALEGLRIGAGSRSAATFLNGGQDKSDGPVVLKDTTAKPGAPAGKVVIPMVRKKGGIEVQIPAELIPRSERESLSLQWVDFYRR